MGTKLYLVRHGETLWNHTARYQGHSDIELSDTGKLQAEAIANRMERLEVDHVIASDLSRAHATALAIANKKGLPVLVDARLREANFGLWEGLTYAEISNKFPDILDRWQADPCTTVLPEGESLQLMAQRIAKAVQEIINGYKGKNIALVTHGGTNRVILAQALGLDLHNFWRLKQDNACLNIVDYYDDLAIVSLVNDTNHL